MIAKLMIILLREVRGVAHLGIGAILLGGVKVYNNNKGGLEDHFIPCHDFVTPRGKALYLVFLSFWKRFWYGPT
jgi:hypothetical protein